MSGFLSDYYISLVLGQNGQVIHRSNAHHNVAFDYTIVSDCGVVGKVDLHYSGGERQRYQTQAGWRQRGPVQAAARRSIPVD